MTIEELRQAVADTVENIIGITTLVVKGDPTSSRKTASDQPREEQPYASVSEIIPDIPQSPDEEFDGPEAVSGDAQLTSRGHRFGTFDLQVFGPNAVDYIAKFRDEYIYQENQDFAYALGITVLDVEPTEDISSLMDTAHEERAQADFRVGYVREKTREVPRIHTVEATGTFRQTDESDIVSSETFESEP